MEKSMMETNNKALDTTAATAIPIRHATIHFVVVFFEGLGGWFSVTIVNGTTISSS